MIPCIFLIFNISPTFVETESGLKQPERIVKSVERKRIIISRRDDGILHVYYKDNTVLDIELQYEIRDILNDFLKGEKGLFIYEAGQKCSITKEARDNAVKIEDEVPALASVIYVQNAVYKMIANFYYKFNKPKLLFYVVSDFEEGIEWLLEQQRMSNTF